MPSFLLKLLPLSLSAVKNLATIAIFVVIAAVLGALYYQYHKIGLLRQEVEEKDSAYHAALAAADIVSADRDAAVLQISVERDRYTVLIREQRESETRLSNALEEKRNEIDEMRSKSGTCEEAIDAIYNIQHKNGEK